MNIAIYLTAGVFIALAAAMLFAYYRARHFGLFIMALIYGASGLIAVMVVHWWPLAVGFALVWVLKLLGLEPWSDAGSKEK